MDEFDKLLISDKDARAAFVHIFNYFECICAGIVQGIMDEEFMREFFQTMFQKYENRFRTYIDYMRTKENAQMTFKHFTAISNKWTN